MIALIVSAAFVGLVHSLAPGHWHPVVLVTKTRRWPVSKAMLGALVAASGHIIVSVLLGAIGLRIGAHLIAQHEEVIEQYSGLVLVFFGFLYALLAYRRHSHCHGHTHHGPKIDDHGPFVFLFMLGFSPCVAALPLFAAAIPSGAMGVALVMAGFAGGVIAALTTATTLVSLGIMKLDHPVFEHYGDVITGLGVAAMGVVLFFNPLHHH